MPVIRGLGTFLREQELIRSEPLDTFRNLTLAIDGVEYFKHSSLLKEPLLAATAGSPLALESVVNAELEKFSAAGITPIFVFGGLLPAPVPFFPSEDQNAEQKQVAWAAAEKGSMRTATFEFKKIDGFISLDLQHAIWQILTHKKVQVLRSPYTAQAQLSWLCQAGHRFAHAAVGGLDLLLYGAPRIVFHLDFQSGVVEWVDRSELLCALSLSSSQLVQACLLAGYAKCRTLSSLEQRGRFAFNAAYDVVREHGSGLAAIQASQVPDEKEYAEVYHSCLEALQRSLVLDQGAKLSMMNLPSESVTSAFPNITYTLLAKGVIAPQVLNNIINKSLPDHAPNVDSEEYALVLEKLTPIRKNTFHLISTALDNKVCLVMNCRWYDPSREIDLSGDGNQANLPAPALLNGEVFQNEEAKDTDSVMSPLSPLRVFNDKSIDDKQKLKELLTRPSDVAASAVLHTLQLTGLFDEKASSILCPSSDASSSSSSSSSSALDIALVYATLLLSYERLVGKRLALVAPDGSSFSAGNNNVDLTDARLIARVMSLLPVTTKGEGWSGPIDRDLAGFCSIVRSIQRTLRNLCESGVLHLFAKQHVQTSSFTGEDYVQLAQSLPFGAEPSTNMGVLGFYFAQGKSVAQLKALFPQATDVEADLKRGLELWNKVKALVVSRKEVDQDSFNQFSKADELVTSLVANLQL